MQMRATTRPCVYGASCISETTFQDFVVFIFNCIFFFCFLPFPFGIMPFCCCCFCIVWELTQCKSHFLLLLLPFLIHCSLILAQFSAIVCADRLTINLNAFFHFQRCRTAIKHAKKFKFHKSNNNSNKGMQFFVAAYMHVCLTINHNNNSKGNSSNKMQIKHISHAILTHLCSYKHTYRDVTAMS